MMSSKVVNYITIIVSLAVFVCLCCALQESQFRLRIREVMENEVAPLVLSLYERAEFDFKLVDIARRFGPAGLQIRGHGEQVVNYSKRPKSWRVINRICSPSCFVDDLGCSGLTSVEAALLTMEMTRVDALLRHSIWCKAVWR